MPPHPDHRELLAFRQGRRRRYRRRHTHHGHGRATPTHPAARAIRGRPGRPSDRSGELAGAPGRRARADPSARRRSSAPARRRDRPVVARSRSGGRGGQPAQGRPLRPGSPGQSQRSHAQGRDGLAQPRRHGGDGRRALRVRRAVGAARPRRSARAGGGVLLWRQPAAGVELPGMDRRASPTTRVAPRPAARAG